MENNIFKNIKLGDYQEQELDTKISAFEIFKRLYPYFESIFLLESLGEDPDGIGAGGKFNRYSYVGFEPDFTVCAKNADLLVDGKLFKTKNPYEEISKLPKVMNKISGYCGGLVGYITYEAAKYFEKAFVGHKECEFPDFEFGYFTDGLKFDKKIRKVTYFHYGNSKLIKVMKLINHSGKLDDFSYKKIGEGLDATEHAGMVKEAIKHIKRGDIFQVVISQKSHFRLEGDKRRVYAVLRQINPSPYMFYFKFKDREIITASPELLISVRGNNIEHFGTLAGTIRRGETPKQDKDFVHKLQNDVKERAEHLMLVDLSRNDLGRICNFGTVSVSNLAGVKKFSHVQHLSTEIRGKLKKGIDAFSALAACFPAGTLSGAPKIEAMKIISSLEGQSRGPYGGVGGYFSFNDEAMLAITIRSIFINRNNAYTQTGSGIVLDSIPECEFQELVNKQEAIEEALRQAQGKQ